MSVHTRKKVFITGIAGFIGYHLARYLHSQGHLVTGCDNFNTYYPVVLKRARAQQLKKLGIVVIDHDIRNIKALYPLFEQQQFSHLFHLAAQAGVRHSLSHPHSYIQNNIHGFLEILELARHFQPMHLLYASSSSVYGTNTKTPFSENDRTIQPASLYAATKASNELMAQSYHHLFHIPMTGLRFFTVYGPWGRPDMAYFSFTKAIQEDSPIQVFNEGKMRRDFTYIDDIVQGCAKAMELSSSSHEIFNLGNNNPQELLYLIQAIENALGKKALIEFKPMQPGDVLETYADIEKSKQRLSFQPNTSLEVGIERFVRWYQSTYNHLNALALP